VRTSGRVIELSLERSGFIRGVEFWPAEGLLDFEEAAQRATELVVRYYKIVFITLLFTSLYMG
jgi:hypothetical protein